MTFPHEPMPLAQAIIQRRSIRAFLPAPVADDTLRAILQLAARAPSGNNIQPWRVHVLRGSARQQLVDAVCAAFDAGDPQHQPEIPYYPPAFVEPHLSRRRQVGGALYRLLGIGRGDRAAMRAQLRRNFDFFAAPVGLMVTIDRRLTQGSWLDCGMFIQTLLLTATAHGLGSCAQAAWIDYHAIISQQLRLDASEQFVCAIALGYPDPDAPANQLASPRAALDEFVCFHPAGPDAPASSAKAKEAT